MNTLLYVVGVVILVLLVIYLAPGGLTVCSLTRCAACGLWTWRGCGRHQDVLLTVAEEQRCTCGQ